MYSSAVERLTADQQVPGSNPGAPFFSLGLAKFAVLACDLSLGMAQLTGQAVCYCCYGDSACLRCVCERGVSVSSARLAQSVERQPFKLVVVGSSPTVGEFVVCSAEMKFSGADLCIEK